MNDRKEKRVVDPWFIEDEFGYKIFRITVDEIASHWCQGFVEEISTWDGDGSKTPLEPFEHYLSFIIKWDGCSHVNFGQKSEGTETKTDGYLHLCGPVFWKRHCELMATLYRWAQKEMPIDDPKDHMPELTWKEIAT